MRSSSLENPSAPRKIGGRERAGEATGEATGEGGKTFEKVFPPSPGPPSSLSKLFNFWGGAAFFWGGGGFSAGCFLWEISGCGMRQEVGPWGNSGRRAERGGHFVRVLARLRRESAEHLRARSARSCAKTRRPLRPGTQAIRIPVACRFRRVRARGTACCG